MIRNNHKDYITSLRWLKAFLRRAVRDGISKYSSNRVSIGDITNFIEDLFQKNELMIRNQLNEYNSSQDNKQVNGKLKLKQLRLKNIHPNLLSIMLMSGVFPTANITSIEIKDSNIVITY